MTAHAINPSSFDTYLPLRKSLKPEKISDHVLVPVPPSRAKNSMRAMIERPTYEKKATSFAASCIETSENDDELLLRLTKHRKKVGEYAIGETLGKGTFGKVKMGIHLITGEKVAIKILEKKKIIEVADAERVAREIKILKRNRHRNVIQLYEVIDTHTRIYLIMEYADGGEMFDFIVRHKRLPEALAASLFQQLLQGLAHVHANGISHRDLKPENLLLQRSKICSTGYLIKIVDFGLSNTHEQGIFLCTACGSPCYAAPELIQGKKYNGPKADTWSLGVILFAMVCGFLPFEDSNTALLYKKILNADYKAPAFLSTQVRHLLALILETNPEQRYTMDMIQQHPWVTSVPSSIQQTLLEEDQEPINCLVLHELQDLGFDTAQLAIDMSSNAHNALTATYYLLYNKRLRSFTKQAASLQSKADHLRVPQLEPYSSRTRSNPRYVQETVSAAIPVTSLVTPKYELHESDLSNRVSDDTPSTGTSKIACLPPSIDRYVSPHGVYAALAKRPSSIQRGRTLIVSQASTLQKQSAIVPASDMQLIPIVPVPPSRGQKRIVLNRDHVSKRLIANLKQGATKNFHITLKPVDATGLAQKHNARVRGRQTHEELVAANAKIYSGPRDIRSTSSQKPATIGYSIADDLLLSDGMTPQARADVHIMKQDEVRIGLKEDECRIESETVRQT